MRSKSTDADSAFSPAPAAIPGAPRFLQSAATRHSELAKLVQECSRLIEGSLTLAALSTSSPEFVRFPPQARAHQCQHHSPSGRGSISGRFDGITLRRRLRESAAVRADGGLLRSVVVNLIDNAAEALENSTFREILVSTMAHSDAETVVICVSDTGTGISPEDKDKLFLPHFSTKDRGNRTRPRHRRSIVAEHGGSIHVEDNLPVGSRFLVELPVAELTPASFADHNGSDATR